jgi:hypothetical protein
MPTKFTRNKQLLDDQKRKRKSKIPMRIVGSERRSDWLSENSLALLSSFGNGIGGTLAHHMYNVQWSVDCRKANNLRHSKTNKQTNNQTVVTNIPRSAIMMARFVASASTSSGRERT